MLVFSDRWPNPTVLHNKLILFEIKNQEVEGIEGYSSNQRNH